MKISDKITFLKCIKQIIFVYDNHIVFIYLYEFQENC
jgi:hypothetical protein